MRVTPAPDAPDLDDRYRWRLLWTLVLGLSGGATMTVLAASLSDVAKLAERTLWYSSNSPAFVRSHVGLLSILQALAYGVYARDKAAFKDRIRAFKLK